MLKLRGGGDKEGKYYLRFYHLETKWTEIVKIDSSKSFDDIKLIEFLEILSKKIKVNLDYLKILDPNKTMI